MRISLINPGLVAQDAIGQCMLNQLRFFRRRGDEVQVYLMVPPEGVPEDVAAQIRVVSLGDLISRSDVHFSQSDLYVFQYPMRYSLLESIKGIDRGVVILYYHNVTPPGLWGTREERDHLYWGQYGISELAPYADLIVTPSPFNADQLVDEYAYERDRIRVLHNAVALDQFAPGPKDGDLLRQYNLEGRQVILFVGRMAGNKRIDLLVEALPLVQQKVPNAVLMLVGDDRTNAALKRIAANARNQADELGVTDDVIITGRVGDLPPYYRLADVYATASLHEGFGVPPIEAMASGTPVVASRATAHPWVIADAGLLVEPGDAVALADGIVRVMTDDSLCGDLVRRGLARSRELSLERYETEWAEIVAEATAWLPEQPYPRPRSVPAQPAASVSAAEPEEPPPAVHEVLLSSALVQLEAAADVMIRGYVVRSKMPVVGRVVAWLRRNLTSHLREPYVDPMFERQVAFNRQMVQLMRQIIEQVSAYMGVSESVLSDAMGRTRELEARIGRMEALAGLLLAQVSLLEAELTAQGDDRGMADMREQIEVLRASLAAGQDQ